jgi:hypothetical protein
VDATGDAIIASLSPIIEVCGNKMEVEDAEEGISSESDSEEDEVDADDDVEKDVQNEAKIQECEKEVYSFKQRLLW